MNKTLLLVATLALFMSGCTQELHARESVSEELDVELSEGRTLTEVGKININLGSSTYDRYIVQDKHTGCKYIFSTKLGGDLAPLYGSDGSVEGCYSEEQSMPTIESQP